MPSFLEFCVIGVLATVFFGHKFSGLGRAFGQCLGAFKEGLADDKPDAAPLPKPLPKALGYTPPDSHAPPS